MSILKDPISIVFKFSESSIVYFILSVEIQKYVAADVVPFITFNYPEKKL